MLCHTDDGDHALHCSLHYGAQLETSTYQHNTADYVYMYLFGMMGLNVCPSFPPRLLLTLCIPASSRTNVHSCAGHHWLPC